MQNNIFQPSRMLPVAFNMETISQYEAAFELIFKDVFSFPINS